MRMIKLTGLLFIIFGVYWLSLEARRFLKTDSLFQTGHIFFEKSNLLNHPEVMKISEANYNLNIFAFNLWKIKKTLENIPQVRKVIVKRKFPNIVEIRLEERKPLFLLNWKESFYGVDKDGYIFPQLEGNPCWDLPVITGLNDKYLENFFSAGEILPEIILALKINDYFKGNRPGPLKLSEVHFGDFDEFSLYTFNPRMGLRFTKDGFKKGFENLDLVLADFDRGAGSIDSMDLRFPEKVFIHLKG